jgi:hypothetical protein
LNFPHSRVGKGVRFFVDFSIEREKSAFISVSIPVTIDISRLILGLLDTKLYGSRFMIWAAIWGVGAMSSIPFTNIICGGKLTAEAQRRRERREELEERLFKFFNIAGNISADLLM